MMMPNITALNYRILSEIFLMPGRFIIRWK